MADDVREHAKIITPTQVQQMGFSFDIIGYAHPEQYPDGVDVIVMAPGQLEPLGSVRLKKGCGLVGVHPETMNHLLAQIQEQRRNMALPGETKAPGIHIG